MYLNVQYVANYGAVIIILNMEAIWEYINHNQ